MKIKIYKFVWPFSSYRVHMASLSKNFDFNLRRDHQKISYERRDYESVDERAYLRLCPEKLRKREFGQ